MDDLQQRILKLEAESAVQNAWIRALVEMLPPPHPTDDAPLLAVIEKVKAAIASLPEAEQAAYRAALDAMSPLSLRRTWAPKR